MVSRKELQITEELFGELLTQIKPIMDAIDLEDVIMFFDHGEYGSAFDGLCDRLDTREIDITREIYDRLAELGNRMELPKLTWEVLESRIEPINPAAR